MDMTTFVSPGNADMLYLLLMLMDKPMNYFRDGKPWENSGSPTYRDVVTEMVCKDWNEQEKTL